MEYQYEPVKHQIDIPIKIFTQTVEQFPYHWHEDMEILFVLEGALEIRVDQIPYELKAGDLFLVNNNELHFIKSKTGFGKTQLLALQFHGDYFNKFKLDISNRQFHLCSPEVNHKMSPLLDEIRSILANMMHLVLNKESYYNIHVEKLMLELIVILMNQFQIDNSDRRNSADQDERLLEILKYVNDHCTDSKIGIAEISERFFLNPQYLSRYFKTQVGVPIKKFLDTMRLNKSLMALRTSEERVLDIALKFGFPDAKAYYRVFKEMFNITPMQYREQHKLELDKKLPKDYFSINSQDALRKLFTYLHIKKETVLLNVDYTEKISLSNKIEAFEHTFTNLMTFGYAPHALRKDFNEHLKLIQNDVGFKYVRFHGIFADELLVYNLNAKEEVYYNYNHVDALLDNLLEADVKPFIELGFMPKALAKTEDTIFWWKAYVTPPKDLSKWTDLIDHFIRHLINRYGIEEIRTWYFEFWNEPEIEQFFWYGSQLEFFDFFKATHKTIKNIDVNLKLGGFGNVLFQEDMQWLKAFEDYATEAQILLDFYSFHVYNLEFEDLTYTTKEVLASLEFSSKENTMEHFKHYGVKIGGEQHITKSIDQVKQKLDQLNCTKKEFWITEWNANTDSRDLVHDTCYMATFIVKNVLENYNKVQGLGFWTFSDIFEEHQLEQSIFHGGFGLMTYNGLKKPSYHAFHFLSKLGDVLIHKTEHYIITKKGMDYQILFYNYCHTNALYSQFDYSQLSMTDRYNVFETCKSKSIQLELEDISGNYKVTKYYSNRDQGSSFDAWVKMGAPTTLDESALNYLKGQSEPGMTVETIRIDDCYTLNTDVLPHEIQLFELKKIY